MRGASSLENDLEDIAPCLYISEFLSLREYKFFGKLNLLSFIIGDEETLGNDLSSVEDSGECGSQEMTLFTAESGVCIDIGVEISSKDVLDQASLLYVNWTAVW